MYHYTSVSCGYKHFTLFTETVHSLHNTLLVLLVNPVGSLLVLLVEIVGSLLVLLVEIVGSLLVLLVDIVDTLIENR